MDLFVLDSDFRRTEIFDRFQSLIWTERYSAEGDFELLINSTRDARALLAPGTFLGINGSSRVMMVKNADDSKSSDGRATLKVSGPSLERFMKDRIFINLGVTTAPDSVWTLSNTPASNARYIFEKICVAGYNTSADNLPYYVPGSIYPAGNIPEPADAVVMDIPIGSVYDRVKEICDAYGMGFRITRNKDLSQLLFNVYMGTDRTSRQITKPAVIFSPELDNLSDVSFLTSSNDFKNIALVQAQNSRRYVYAAGYDGSEIGFQRQVMYVDASDLKDAAGTTLTAKMGQRGYEALSKQTTLSAFDGEITQNSQYKYEKDYFLGDLVEIRNADKGSNDMVVTEHIYVSDGEGDRSYPTLALKQLVNAGSWYAWPPTQVWNDLTDPAQTWDSLP